MCRPMSKNELRRVVIQILTDRTVPMNVGEIKVAIEYNYGDYLECPTGPDLIIACNGMVESGQLELLQPGRIHFYLLAV